MQKALITGVSGMDGSTLSEILLDQGYEVHGIIRRCSTSNTQRIDHIKDKLHLHYGDVVDAGGVAQIVSKVMPDMIFHLAAMSHVRISFDIPQYTTQSIVGGTLSVLDAVRNYKPDCRVYYAGSSEMFGNMPCPHNEQTAFNPQSPYACAKVNGFHLAKLYREAYGLFIASGVLHNHEGPRRQEEFVTRKITMGAAKIKLGLKDKLYLGNLYAKRDWGYAPEFCQAMILMMQQSKPDDYVIATGESHSVQEFVEECFSQLNLDWRKHVVIDEKLKRPSELHMLLGDASKAKRELGWEPKVKFKELCKIMLEHDLKLVEKQH